MEQPVFKLPSAVRQQRRPVSTKQHAFRHKRKGYHSLNAVDKDELRLKWFVADDLAIEAVRGGMRKVTVADLHIQNFSRCLDYSPHIETRSSSSATLSRSS